MSETPTIDILGALSSTKTTRGNRTCRIQRWLDDIPEDTEGKDQLVATLTTNDPRSEHWRTLEELDALLGRLGLETSIKTIANHRSGERCRCFA